MRLNLTNMCLVALLPAAMLLAGCLQDVKPADFSGRMPVVRVLVLEGKSSVSLTASQPPIIRTNSAPSPHRLNVQSSSPITVSLTSAGWRVGAAIVGSGEIQIQ